MMVRQEDWRRDLQTSVDLPEVGHLLAVAHLLNERDQSFAVSLIDQAQKRGSLSEKQLFWVKELTARATRIAIAPQAPAAPAAAPAPAAFAFRRIVELFAKAGNRAAIVFRTASGTEFRLSVAGERAQQPGTINVTDAGTSFENRIWYGRIALNGAWQPSRKIDAIDRLAVAAALTLFDTDPAAAAASYGHSTSHCCFCRRELTDERSITVGYGEICADRWGLPWGEVPGKAPVENKLTCDVPF